MAIWFPCIMTVELPSEVELVEICLYVDEGVNHKLTVECVFYINS